MSKNEAVPEHDATKATFLDSAISHMTNGKLRRYLCQHYNTIMETSNMRTLDKHVCRFCCAADPRKIKVRLLSRNAMKKHKYQLVLKSRDTVLSTFCSTCNRTEFCTAIDGSVKLRSPAVAQDVVYNNNNNNNNNNLQYTTPKRGAAEASGGTQKRRKSMSRLQQQLMRERLKSSTPKAASLSDFLSL